MQRLTFEGNFCDIAKCQETPGGSFCENGACSQRKVWERLKYYEDMEEQGRLFISPVKVGQTVWCNVHGLEAIEGSVDAFKLAIAALREQEQREWISVKERLPEHGQRVLVCDVKDHNSYAGVWIFEKDPDDGSDCWEGDGGWWQPFEQVTHWMPLPEPPKEGADHA